MVRPMRILSSLGAMVLVSMFGMGCGGPAGRAELSPGNMPPTGNFHGRYSSVQYGTMELCVSGAQVMGTFEKNERHGTVQGTIQGDALRFQWEEERELVPGRPMRTRGRGYFRYSIAEDENHYLIGGEWTTPRSAADPGERFDSVEIDDPNAPTPTRITLAAQRMLRAGLVTIQMTLRAIPRTRAIPTRLGLREFKIRGLR
jgi:hypothetical protein